MIQKTKKSKGMPNMEAIYFFKNKNDTFLFRELVAKIAEELSENVISYLSQNVLQTIQVQYDYR